MNTTAFKDPLLPPLTPECARLERDRIFKALGSGMSTFIRVMDLLTDTSITIKTVQGHYIYKNRYSIESANLPSLEYILGKRAQDIYPPKTWHIYVEREAKVLETGIPFINQTYGFASDLSTQLNSVSGFPLCDRRGKIIALLTTFRRVASASQNPSWHGQMHRIIEHINEDVSEDLSVSTLAKLAGMSASHFFRVFSTVTQDTPNQYVNKVRVNAAKVLLETTDKLLSNIATETGFCDQSHFHKTFKRITGLTPAKYRKQHWSI